MPEHIRHFNADDWPGEHYDLWGLPGGAHLAWCNAREEYALLNDVELDPFDGLWALVAVGAVDGDIVQKAWDER